MFLSQRPMQYVDHYGGYQPDYQEASMEHNDWISEEIHYLGDQEDFQFQPYNNNLSYWSEDVENPEDQAYPPFQGQQWSNYQNVEYPQDQVYTPFKNQQGQGNYQGYNYGNQECYQEQMNSFNNQGQPSQDDDIMSMFKQLLEGQESEKEEIFEMKACCNDLNSKIEGLETYVKKLENQIAQVASTSENNGNGVLPEKPEPNPNEYCQDIILRSETELPSRGEAEKIDESKEETERPEEEKESLEKEADCKVLKEEDSQQKVLKVKQCDFGLLDATKVGNEKLLDSHKIHDGETSFMEIKEGLNVMEIKKASKCKTSMESEREAENQDDWSKLKTPNTKMKPFPQGLWYEFSDLNSTFPVIVNDALTETETKTFLVKLISDSRWVPPMHVKLKKGGLTVIKSDLHELIPIKTITSHRMCLDYREFNASTRKNHFPWPFTDQMLTNFSVYGDALFSCMSNLCRALKRCAETNLVLNWKKCHFMEREGTKLGHIIPEKGIEVDKAKVAGPLTHLLCKDTSFDFNEACLEAFTKIKMELIKNSTVKTQDWSFPFESGGDFTVTLSELTTT